MSKPIAVLISDIHYNLNTLKVADAALKLAIHKANDLGVDLIITGDLHDTKANLRSECFITLKHTLAQMNGYAYIVRGNHDSNNEKSKETSLELFSSENILIVNNFDCSFSRPDWHFIAYQHDANDFLALLNRVPKGATVFCHQGITGSNSGHYIQDKSAVPLELLWDYRVISGHYHTRQTLGVTNANIGRFDYVGNPYTLGFGEANDPAKGFQVLLDDGSLEFVPTNLRRHVILEVNTNDLCTTNYREIRDNDIVWMKVTGPSDALSTLTKQHLKATTGIAQDFRLDLIPMDSETSAPERHEDLSQADLFDSLIDSLTKTDDGRKYRLKKLWKDLI